MLHFPNNKREQVLSVQHGINCRREESQISEPGDTTIREKAANPLHLSRRKAISLPNRKTFVPDMRLGRDFFLRRHRFRPCLLFKAALHIVELAGVPRAYGSRLAVRSRWRRRAAGASQRKSRRIRLM